MSPLHLLPLLHGCRKLGQKVFSRPGVAAVVKDEDVGWRESLYRVYKSGQASSPLLSYTALPVPVTYKFTRPPGQPPISAIVVTCIEHA